MDAKPSQGNDEPVTDRGDFTLDDESLIRFEEALSRWRDTEHEVWLLRDSLFDFLALETDEARLRFKLGFFSYLPQLLLSCLSARRTRNETEVPTAEFLVFIGGPISKEFDTLQPIVSELSRTHSVLVLWVSEEPPDAEAKKLLRPARVWHVRPEEPIAASRFTVLANSARVFRLLLRVALACRDIKGIGRAFWQHSAQLFDYLVSLRFWERFLTRQLARQRFRAVAFASDVNPPGKVLAKMGKRRGWCSHHFLHGFPGLVHTWSIATDIHTFSEIERDFFLRHRWPPTKVHALGHPRQCSLVRQIQQHRDLEPAEGGLRVLFAGQHAVKGGYDEEQHHRTMQVLLEAVTCLHLTPTEFRVRLHPADNPAVYEKHADKYAPHLGKEAISNRSVSEDLAWANVVVTVSSTMAVEACYAECFLIWLGVGNFRFEIREKLVAAGYGRLANSATQLCEALSECRQNATRSQLIDRLMKRGRELGILNPHAASDAAARIVNTKNERAHL